MPKAKGLVSASPYEFAREKESNFHQKIVQTSLMTIAKVDKTSIFPLIKSSIWN
jgi:hypothetical protein